MVGTPERNEAAPYYFKYIDRITAGDILEVLETQMDEALAFLRNISEEKSLFRYAPEKWSLREVLNHINDVERLFLFRAIWFARGFESPLPSYDQGTCAAAAQADRVSWTNHVEEFRAIRRGTLAFFRNMPTEAWSRSGTASDNPFTVRSLAYILAGHLDHHLALIRERYI